MAFPLHHCHKSCRWLVAYRGRTTHGDREKIAQVTQSNKVKGAWPTVIEACLLTTRSKIFRQHLKCSLTGPRRAGTSSGFFFFFVSFHSASCLSLGDLVQRCLGQPVDLLAPWPSAAVIPRQLSTAVHFQSVERAESRGTWKGWRTFAWMNWLSCGDTDFFFFNAYAEKDPERTRREGRQNSPLASQ